MKPDPLGVVLRRRSSRQSSRQRKLRNRVSNRSLGVESLEDRRVLTSAWHNVLAPLNVDDSDRNTVSPIDALIIINELTNRNVIDESGRLPETPEGFTVPPYFDVNNDGFVSPIDALRVINALTDGPIIDAAIESELGEILAATPDLVIEHLPNVALGYSGDSGEFITSSTANDVPPAIVNTSDGGSVIVWVAEQDCVGVCDDPPHQIMTQRFSAAGLPVGEASVAVEGAGTVRSLDLGLTSNDGLILTWAQRNGSDWNVFVQNVVPEGEPTSPTMVNETVLGTQQSPAIAVVGETEFAVVWQGEQSGPAIFARYYNGDMVSGEIVHSVSGGPDDGPITNLHPDIARVEDGYFITWTSKS